LRKAFVRLLKNSAQRANLQPNRSLAEESDAQTGVSELQIALRNPILPVQGVFQQPVIWRACFRPSRAIQLPAIWKYPAMPDELVGNAAPKRATSRASSD